ncbi:hypothetical protein DTO012A8_8592 [Penicillium roqueforti]|nr:hypothetical protein DTO012A8_8592 [Penicillium roqueforti]
MEQHPIPAPTNIPPTRRNKPRIRSINHRNIGLSIRTRNALRRSIAHIIRRVGKAMSGIKQKVRIPMENQIRCLDQRAITISSTAIEDLHRVPDRRDTVGANLLQQDRRGNKRFDAVVAVSAVADAVAVDFENDVATAVFVFEPCWVD